MKRYTGILESEKSKFNHNSRRISEMIDTLNLLSIGSVRPAIAPHAKGTYKFPRLNIKFDGNEFFNYVVMYTDDSYGIVEYLLDMQTPEEQFEYLKGESPGLPDSFVNELVATVNTARLKYTDVEDISEICDDFIKRKASKLEKSMKEIAFFSSKFGIQTFEASEGVLHPKRSIFCSNQVVLYEDILSNASILEETKGHLLFRNFVKWAGDIPIFEVFNVISDFES